MKERGRRSTSRDALFGGLRGSKDYNGLSVLVGDQGAVAHKLVDLREIRLLGRIAGLEGLHHSPARSAPFRNSSATIRTCSLAELTQAVSGSVIR